MALIDSVHKPSFLIRIKLHNPVETLLAWRLMFGVIGGCNAVRDSKTSFLIAAQHTPHWVLTKAFWISFIFLLQLTSFQSCEKRWKVVCNIELKCVLKQHTYRTHCIRPVSQLVPWVLLSKRSIFQTFWKDDCCPKSLFIELDNSNFGYLLIFKFCLTVQSFSKIGQH